MPEDAKQLIDALTAATINKPPEEKKPGS